MATVSNALPLISRRGLIGATCLLTSALMAGCAQDGAPAGDAENLEGILSVGILRPVSLDPFALVGTSAEQIASQIFEPLVRFDYTTGELVGAAAERFDISEDARTFTFHLRERVFHDGGAVTARDFKRAWERLVNPASAASAELGASPNAYRLAVVEGYDALAAGDVSALSGVSCPDERTLEVHLVEPYADFASVLAHPSLAAVPASAEEDVAAFGSSPIGAGPFRMEGSWGKNSTAVRLTRFDGYTGDAPVLAGARFQVFSDTVSAYQEFLTGSLDMAACPVDELEGAIARYGRAADGLTVGPGAHLVQAPDLATSYLALNVAAAPFDNADVRRALSLAVDRQGLVGRVYRDTHLVADGIVPPFVSGYRDAAWPYTVYDPARARELLDAAYPANDEGVRGEPFSLIYTGGGGNENAIEQIVEDFAAVGIECEPEELEEQVFYERVRSGDYQIARLDVVTERPVTESVLFPLFHSRCRGGSNVSGFASEEVDSLIDQARAARDDASREALLAEADTLIGEEAPIIPLTYPMHAFACTAKANGLVIDPAGVPRLAEIPPEE